MRRGLATPVWCVIEGHPGLRDVPRPALARFMAQVREDFRHGPGEVIHGT